MKRVILFLGLSCICGSGYSQNKLNLFKAGFSDDDPPADYMGWSFMAGFSKGYTEEAGWPGGVKAFPTFGLHAMVTTDFSLLGMVLRDLYKKSPVFIGDYETVGFGVGYSRTDSGRAGGDNFARYDGFSRSWGTSIQPFWLGYELGAGGQAVIRVNKAVDLGTRLYFAGYGDASFYRALPYGLFFSPNIRVKNIRLEYAHVISKPKLDKHEPPLSIIKIKYYKADQSKFIGLRSDFAFGKNLNAGTEEKIKNFSLRFCIGSSL